ncbi:MAG: hypothetical protein M3P44_17625 [Actinomycetota bacterium]|nr:hypothetical protein [Actinomycetota bacterium]
MSPRSRRAVTAALLAAVCLPPAAAAAPRVISSAGLPADAGHDAAWQQFFTDLPHGPELDSLTVVLAPPDEVTRRCGRGADGCYRGLLRQMVIPGTAGPEDSYIADVARHEYGHHLAAQGDNAPFDASLGTKRWFTHERICERLRSGELSGSGSARYEVSAAEGFAEAYRVTAGVSPHLWIVDPALFPDAGARRAILADVHHPWSGAREQRFTGRLTRRRPERTLSLRVPLDGTVEVEATGSARLRPELTLAAGSTVLARGRRRLRYVDCGRRVLRLTIRARRGGGRFAITARRP